MMEYSPASDSAFLGLQVVTTSSDVFPRLSYEEENMAGLVQLFKERSKIFELR